MVPDEERDLSRYHNNQESKPQDSKSSKNSSSKFEEIMKELDEGLRLRDLEDKKEEEKMRKRFEEIHLEYKNTLKKIRSKYPNF